MNNPSVRIQRILAAIGLGFVALSIGSVLVVPGTFWNWGLLLVALAFVFLSRRAGSKKT